MMNTASRNNLRTVSIGLLAIAAGSVVPAVEGQISRVFCRVTSDSSTTVASQDGFANALIDIAESVCEAAAGETRVAPIDVSISTVASAMAEAVAEVVGECAGVGNAEVSVRGAARAETRAQAVGRASASILASSTVCGLCESALESMTEAVESVAAVAVAEENFVFSGETVTVGDVQRVVEENIVNLLASITGSVTASNIDGCSADAINLSQAGDSVAMCDVSISADDIITEINAVADAGLAVSALACEGDVGSVESEVRVREVAVAVARAVAQADSFCEASGGPGTVACGLSRGTIDAIASAQASAFFFAMAEALNPGCECDLTVTLTAEEVQTLIAEASTSALASTCVDGSRSALVVDFQMDVEEVMTEVLAEAIADASAGAECTVGAGGVIEFRDVSGR